MWWRPLCRFPRFPTCTPASIPGPRWSASAAAATASSWALLMNIPADLYESARIDGANPFQMFMKITLPYMLFVTGPFLLTQFTGNLNNFNVIFLLTQGKPQSMALTGNAGYTDLLVTWLYKMTVNDTNYKMAAVIGIMVFIVTAVISLVVYNILPSVKDEEGFQ